MNNNYMLFYRCFIHHIQVLTWKGNANWTNFKHNRILHIWMKINWKKEEITLQKVWIYEPRQANCVFEHSVMINLTAHAQPFRGARDLAFCLKVPLDSLLVWASSEGSGEPARMRRLAWTFAARVGYKYQIRLTRSIFKMAVTCTTILETWCHKNLMK